MAKSLLPDQFAELESFATTWCLPTERERYQQRLDAPMEELQAFYDALFPRVDEAVRYCDQYALGQMPADVVNLMYLIYSLVAISFAVELWGQTRVPDTGASALPCLVEPAT
jgi:hypothetical protein